MQTVLVVTDFSAESRHALEYACRLVQDKEVAIVLLHIYPVPITYTTEGLALAAIQDAIDRAEGHIEDEIAWVAHHYPQTTITARVIADTYLKTLRHETLAVRPLFVVLGTAGYGNTFPGDDDPLDALRTIPAPVLFVPRRAPLRLIRHVAFASNYAFATPRIPTDSIMDWIRLMEANLTVVHTDAEPRGKSETQSAGEAWLRDQLAPVAPKFKWVQDENVISGLAGFIGDHDVDCLLVVPRRQGFWQNLLHHSRTKALARLDSVPVIAFPERA
jgi:hypothetical protein